MQPIKYSFRVLYQTKNAKQASDFLNCCDLNVGELCFEETISFLYNGGEKPIEYFKDLITQGYVAQECSIFKIEGGKIE